MTTSVVKTLLIRASQTRDATDAMKYTQAALSAAQALQLASLDDDLYSEPMTGGQGGEVVPQDVDAIVKDLIARGIVPDPRQGHTDNVACGIGGSLRR